MRYYVEVTVREPGEMDDIIHRPADPLTAIRNDLQTLQNTPLSPLQRDILKRALDNLLREQRLTVATRGFGIPTESPRDALHQAGEMLTGHNSRAVRERSA